MGIYQHTLHASILFQENIEAHRIKRVVAEAFLINSLRDNV